MSTREAAKVHRPQIQSTELTAVICGTYHRDLEGLRRDYEILRAQNCSVLSPSAVVFPWETDGFVYTERDLGKSPREIEAEHLAHLAIADFAWVHAPDGYVGVSGAMELGYCHAIGLPTFTSSQLSDVTLAAFAQVVPTPSHAADVARRSLRQPKTGSLRLLQEYYARVAEERGYDKETVLECMLLLTEEIGELARAVRTQTRVAREHSYKGSSVEDELADVQLYLVHMANILSVDLSKAVQNKERQNTERTIEPEEMPA